MKQYPLLHHRAAKVLFVLFLTAMLFLSRDTLFSSCLVGFAKSQILMLGLIALLGVLFLWVNRKEILQILKDRRTLVLLASALVIVLPMVLKRDWQLMYFSILLCLLFAVFITYFTTSRETSKYYVVILCLLGFYSIIATYGLRELAQAGQIHPSVFYNSNEWDFYNFGFSYVVTWEYWHRNFGIFREPGVYQFFVLLGLYLNNYYVDWDKLWKTWVCNGILVATMISTFAIGGFAELGLFAVFLYFDKKLYREKWGRIAGITVVLVFLTVVGCFFYRMRQPYFELSMFYEFYDMFLRLFTKSESSTDRLNAILTNIRIFVKHPLMGDTIANVLHGTNHNTSSTLLLFAILGVTGGLVNVAAWVALAWDRNRSLFGNLVLLLILFMSFNTQNLVANVFFWLFPMMALVERGLPKLKLSAKKE